MMQKETLSLRFFILRSQVLSLYRTFFRLTKRIQSTELKLEFRKEIRLGFRTPHAENSWKNRNEAEIKYLLSYGKQRLQELKQTIGALESPTKQQDLANLDIETIRSQFEYDEDDKK
eukprot:c16159_g1_i1.p1 GENE.c16159_g1_i1~~c16159_g1_i1.p1  ORF type:complete len:117 (-),score=21.54 c16159_g1_i1:51-401(-)